MTIRIVKVTKVGFFEIKDEDFEEVWDGATSFKEALDKQRQWLEDGECPSDELMSEKYPTHTVMEFASPMDTLKYLGGRTDD